MFQLIDTELTAHPHPADADHAAALREARQGAALAASARGAVEEVDEPFGVAAFIVIATLAVCVWLVQSATTEAAPASDVNTSQLAAPRV